MSTVSAAPVIRFAAQRPDPNHFWVRFGPRAWPGRGRPWTDIARGSLGGLEGTGEELPGVPAPAWSDVVYLPPVPAALAAARESLASPLVAAGVPVLLQLVPGEVCRVAGAAVIYDLLDTLLGGDLSPLSLLPRGAAAVWPLIPGLTDLREVCEEGCELLAAGGASYLQPQALDLAPAERRALADLTGRGFEALFHADPPSERALARIAHARGLGIFVPRPLPSSPPAAANNRRLAEALGLTAELWSRLGRPAARAQTYFRSMRELDRLPQDASALAREGNLGILAWLDRDSRRIVEESLAGGSSLLAELYAEYAQVDAQSGRQS